MKVPSGFAFLESFLLEQIQWKQQKNKIKKHGKGTYILNYLEKMDCVGLWVLIKALTPVLRIWVNFVKKRAMLPGQDLGRQLWYWTPRCRLTGSLEEAKEIYKSFKILSNSWSSKNTLITTLLVSFFNTFISSENQMVWISQAAQQDSFF